MEGTGGGRGGVGEGGLRRGGGEEAWALSLALLCLALSGDQTWVMGYQRLQRKGPLFSHCAHQL